MKNILSYNGKPVFYGLEINRWVSYQIENATSHIDDALWLKRRYPHIEDSALYKIDSSSCEKSKRRKLLLCRVV